MTVTIEKYADTDALVAAAGDRLVEAINAAISARNEATIVLTGGGTGIGLLKRVEAPVDQGSRFVLLFSFFFPLAAASSF